MQHLLIPGSPLFQFSRWLRIVSRTCESYRSAVADDELTLAAANQDHRVDGLQAGREGLVDALTRHNAEGLQLGARRPSGP